MEHVYEAVAAACGCAMGSHRRGCRGGATSLDAQQRTATDLDEVRTRLQSIEQILRTVDAG